MQILQRVLMALGFRVPRENDRNLPDYPLLLQAAVERVCMSQKQMQEATTFEDMDIARSQLLSAQAEVQQVIRAAKRERGIPLRPVMENEELHRNLRDFLNHRPMPTPDTKQLETGTGR